MTYLCSQKNDKTFPSVNRPAFVLGRTQELIYELDRINPGMPLFINSPSGIRITRPQMLVRLHIKPHGKQGELG